jgi:hypothetical protein
MLRWGKEKTGDEAQGETAPQVGATSSTETLAKVLLEQGQVSKERLADALHKQEETGAFLGEILVEEGLLDEKSLISFLAKHCKIPHLSLLDYLIDKEIIDLVPQDICLRFRLLPIDRLGSNLTVAMVNPLDQHALEAVRAHCPSLRIKPILCAYQHWRTVTARLFASAGEEETPSLSASSLGLKIPRPAATAEDSAEAAPAESPQPEARPAPPDATDAPAPKPDTAPPTQPVDGDAVFDAIFSESRETEQDEVAPAPEAPSTPQPETANAAASGIMSEMASVMMDSMRDTYAMLARRMELFRGLDPEDVARIFSRGMTLEVPAGKVIFEKGDEGDAMYVILGGALTISDDDKVLATLNRGDMFGEMALISNEVRSARACAAEDTSLLRLTSEIIHNVMPPEVSRQLLVNIVVTLSARLRRANE